MGGATQDSSAGLKRSVSLPFIILYGLGTTLGAGIYVLIGEVAGRAGMHTPLAFVLSGIVCGLSAFAFAELSGRFPRSAGEAVYVQQAFGLRPLSVVIGLMVAFAGIVSAATIANGFVGYLGEFIDIPGLVAVTALVLVLGALAAWGIAESVALASVITLLEAGGLLFVAWAGATHLPPDLNVAAALADMVTPTNSVALMGIFWGGFLAFYAFIGFEDMVNVAEEVHNPRRNMPLAIIAVLILTMIIYVLVATIAVLAMPPADLAASEAPLASLYTEATGEPATVISVISLFAVVNGALIQMIMAARVLYGMSNAGWLPPVFARIHPRTRTPLIATVVTIALVLLFALALPIVQLAELTSITALTIFAAINVACIIVKRTQPAAPGLFTIPTWVPYAGTISTCGLATAQFISFVQ